MDFPEKKKRAIITFDYEVFLGRNTGTLANCVINPTKAILKILKENNARAIFFVDTTWLMFLKEYFSDNFRIVAGQLRDIIETGSSVELHLHPQWLDAYKTQEQISFKSFEHYKLHSLTDIEISDLFNKSTDLLENITHQKVSCFRAGGWCIEPFDRIRDAFKMNGIRYDFSVAPGLFIREGKPYDFDYSNVTGLPFYKFQDNATIPDGNGSFMEIPLSTYKNNAYYRIANKVMLKIRKDTAFGDGTGGKEKSISRRISQLLNFSYGMLTLDKTSNFLFRYILINHFRKSQLLVIVSHPKLTSPEALQNLSFITSKYRTLNSKDLESFII